MDKPKISIGEIEVDSFMEVYDSFPEKAKLAVELKAYDHYWSILVETFEKQIPYEDMPFLVNVVRTFMVIVEVLDPEMYKKALDMHSEEELRKNLSKIMEE